VLSNADIAELLSQQAESERGILSRAFRRAARSAFLWPENVTDLAAQNRSLTELRGIGQFIEKQIRGWLDKPPPLSTKIPAIRQDFISLAEARQLLAKKPSLVGEPARRFTNAHSLERRIGRYRGDGRCS
jgi:DNA polymerase/3'-5' exonuclease PolX